MSDTYLVGGMTCDGCVRAVTNAIERVIPGASVSVDLAAGRVTVDGANGDSAVAEAVADAGFDFDGKA
ncbi:MAG: heavy metal-associated domain-containing protein [Alphaproteobacteria bacterium]|jgi:copper chaperone